jgi:hypothetical protein
MSTLQISAEGKRYEISKVVSRVPREILNVVIMRSLWK